MLPASLSPADTLLRVSHAFWMDSYLHLLLNRVPTLRLMRRLIALHAVWEGSPASPSAREPRCSDPSRQGEGLLVVTFNAS